MSKRINLFRPLLRERSRALKPEASQFKFTPRVIFAGGSIALFFILFVPAFFKYHSQVSENQAKAEALEAKIAEVTKQAQAQAEIIRDAKRKEAERKRELASKVLTTSPVVAAPGHALSGIDDTWASILWKLTTFTTRRILIEKLEFSKGTIAGGTSNTAASTAKSSSARTVQIDGSATSLSALEDWIEALSYNMPTGDFVMDKVADRQLSTSASAATGAGSSPAATTPKSEQNKHYRFHFNLTARFS